MAKPTDIACKDVALYFLPIEMRVPLKFGHETSTHVTCARVCMRVEDAKGNSALGWGETPLSIGWAWPSELAYQERFQEMKNFCVALAEAWRNFEISGHPIEVGDAFLRSQLPAWLKAFNDARDDTEPMPHLAGLICCSPFDVALHDAYGMLLGKEVWQTYNAEFMSADLADLIDPADGLSFSLQDVYPEQFIQRPRPDRIRAWHLVGGKDPVSPAELTGDEPDDGYPVLLRDWIRRDGLKCLKIKLRGNDAEWDYGRIVQVGRMAVEEDVEWLTTDFNCTVTEPLYVTDILDRLMMEEPRLHGMVLYVEQPFPYDLEANRIDVHAVSARKPLFMDESAHDWKMIALGRSLGWSGVALKTCKTQTGALLSLAWAKAHDMTLMVQDLTNPMLAQIPHLLLGAHAGTIMGVETNSMQFYPEASLPEAAVHPGLYTRREGCVDLRTVRGAGFGYRIQDIQRELPRPVVDFD